MFAPLFCTHVNMCNSSKFAVIAVHSQNGNACLHTHYHHLEEPKVFAYSTPQSGSQEFRFDFKVILRSCATPTAAQVLCTFWKCYHNILQWEICFAYRTTEYYLSFYEQTLCISWNPFQKFLLYVHVMIWHCDSSFKVCKVKVCLRRMLKDHKMSFCDTPSKICYFPSWSLCKFHVSCKCSS